MFETKTWRVIERVRTAAIFLSRHTALCSRLQVINLNSLTNWYHFITTCLFTLELINWAARTWRDDGTVFQVNPQANVSMQPPRWHHWLIASFHSLCLICALIPIKLMVTMTNGFIKSLVLPRKQSRTSPQIFTVRHLLSRSSIRKWLTDYFKVKQHI